jgi:hypothetical protein
MTEDPRSKIMRAFTLEYLPCHDCEDKGSFYCKWMCPCRFDWDEEDC